MITSYGLLLTLIAADPAGLDESPGETPRGFAATAHYEPKELVGWTVLIHRELPVAQPELTRRTLSRLANQLEQIADRLPPEALAKLRKVKIWVEEAEPNHACMAYHPDAGWLREHGMNPEKAGAVEIANARNFLDWTNHQPWMVLHELAHAYHHQFLPGGFENDEVAGLFQEALKAGRYARVLRWDGEKVRSYAETNPMEYFAESTEAYFGTNDFYPFVRAELAQHDPAMHALVQRLWSRP